MTLLEKLSLHTVMAVGTICTFIYLAYVYAKSQSLFIAAFARIAMNNAAQSFRYVFVNENLMRANLATVLAMFLVIVGQYAAGGFKVFQSYSP